MSPPNLTAPPATAPSPSAIPAFADLAADPEIAPLLEFEPVVRKIRRPDGWTPELQRELIARIAATGTVQSAVWQMGKHATGAEALYKVPTAAGFRASWDAAVAIGRRRNGLDSQPPWQGPVPGIQRRNSSPERNHTPSPPLGGEGWGEGDWGKEAEIADADHEALTLSLLRKLLLKVQQERQARLAGNVVAADFTLRQVTFLEVALDLALENQGIDPWAWLANLRRGGHNLIEIAQTPFSRFLDDARRAAWAGELPDLDRPAPTAEELLRHRNGYSLEPLEATTGKTPRDHQQQMAEYEARHRREAAAQIQWEAAQRRD